MAVYTTLVRHICEFLSGKTESVGRKETASVISEALPKIFDFDFPIFDEAYRTTLETKIIRHYYYKEIGLETVALWQDRLETKLNEIMPYYNSVYKTIVNEFNPNYDCDWYRVGHKIDGGTERNTGTVSSAGSNTGTITNNGTNTGTVSDQGSGVTTRTPELNTRVYSNDTPQGALTATLDSNTYLTDYTRTEQTGNEETETRTGNTTTNNLSNSNTQTNNLQDNNTRTDDLTKKFDNTNDYTEHVYGIQNASNYINMIADFRNQLINIDMLIINELSDLFMNIY